MTRIYPISDLHLEFCRNPTNTLSQHIPPDLDVDVVVVAGDLCCLGKGLCRALTELERRDYHTIFVPGNHEAYHSSIGAVREFARAWNRNPAKEKVHILDRDSVIVEQTRFVGGTMWFPPGNAPRRHEHLINDYHYIAKFSSHIQDENTAFWDWLSPLDLDGAVVVTHHAPSRQSIAPRFEDGPLNLNAFYYDPAGEDILTGTSKPQLWIHGHTHSGCNYQHDPSGVQIVSNPVGYPFDSRDEFDQTLVVEVK